MKRLLALVLLAASPLSAAEPSLPAPVMADDGFYHPTWFLNSFLDLPDDIRDAHAAGRQVVLVVEQRGCGACKRVHEVNLRIPQVVDYIRPRFSVIQLDLYGSREITDVDGEKLSEKDYARKLGVRATPTLLFLKDSPTAGGPDAVAWKVTGYLEPEPFVNAFAFAHQRSFKGADFIAWMKSADGTISLR